MEQESPSNIVHHPRKVRAEQLILDNLSVMQELKMAAEFQRAVLPKLIELPYLRSACIYKPYGDVSGDVYDFLMNREREIAVFLGDATGHGIVAALMTMMVHLGLESLRRNLPTDESMSRLNTLLASRETGRSVTGVFLRVSPDGRLSVTHAGHPPLLLIPANGAEVVAFKEGGCALGTFIDEPIPYKEEYYQLHAGDKMFAYTDAVIEWKNNSREDYGEERLIDLLDQLREVDINTLCEKVYSDVESFSEGCSCNDDLTMLAFEYIEDNS